MSATTADQANFAPPAHDATAFLPPALEPALTSFDEIGEDVRAAATVTLLTAALLAGGIAMALLLGA